MFIGPGNGPCRTKEERTLAGTTQRADIRAPLAAEMVGAAIQETETRRARGHQPERSCIVTREAGSPDDLLRFVAGPDGTIVPDLRRRLPGRGAWVTATRARVDEAARRRLFARALKANVSIEPDLGARVDALLAADALSALSMARKAGALVTGHAKVDGTVRNNEALALVHASDAADDGVRKLAQAVRAVGHQGGAPVPAWRPFSTDETAEALGLPHPVHLALLATGKGAGAARAALERIERLVRYREPPGQPSGTDPPPREAAP